MKNRLFYIIHYIRQHINRLVEPDNRNKISSLYDLVMFIAIVIGIYPLMFRTQTVLHWYFDLVSGLCFIIDYLLRWSVADLNSKRNKWIALAFYPITPMAIIDLLSILPIFNILSPVYKVVRVSRLLKMLRIIRIVRYFESLIIIVEVIRRQGKFLLTVLFLAVFYIFITALIMFNAEQDINPETGQYLFENFFSAFYWAACTLTTVGYGDLCPVSDTGRIICIISSLVGIAIIALPSGIITGGYMDEMKRRREMKSKKQKKTRPNLGPRPYDEHESLRRKI